MGQSLKLETIFILCDYAYFNLQHYLFIYIYFLQIEMPCPTDAILSSSMKNTLFDLLQHHREKTCVLQLQQNHVLEKQKKRERQESSY